jgi:hypothetical protein
MDYIALRTHTSLLSVPAPLLAASQTVKSRAKTKIGEAGTKLWQGVVM